MILLAQLVGDSVERAAQRNDSLLPRRERADMMAGHPDDCEGEIFAGNGLSRESLAPTAERVERGDDLRVPVRGEPEYGVHPPRACARAVRAPLHADRLPEVPGAQEVREHLLVYVLLRAYPPAAARGRYVGDIRRHDQRLGLREVLVGKRIGLVREPSGRKRIDEALEVASHARIRLGRAGEVERE